jgi:hypothetical protein
LYKVIKISGYNANSVYIPTVQHFINSIRKFRNQIVAA